MKNFRISTISYGIVIGIVTLILGLSAFMTITCVSNRQVANSTAFSSSSASTTHYDIGELLLNTSSATAEVPFNKDNVTKLVNMIYNGAGDAVTQVNSLKTQLTDATDATEPNAITASDLRSNQYIKSSGQSIVVRLGGLDWIVTFVSKDINGNVVATLWLSSNYQSAWSGKNQNLGDHYGFAGGGLFSDFSDDIVIYSRVPDDADNMYGISYIRCETLNNPENRLYYKNGTAMTATAKKTTTATHPFALFTAETLGLTNYITTPSQMKWMYNVQDPALRNEPTYWLNNESLTANNVYNYQASSGWGYWQPAVDEPKTYYDYTSDTKYANWGEDYLWLPSMAEVGYGTDSNSVARNGLWELNNAERSNADGSTEYVSTTYIGSTQSNDTGKAYNSTWVRSAGSGGVGAAYSLAPSGSSVAGQYLHSSLAVRPAMLLNLSNVIKTLSSKISFNKQNGSGGSDSVDVATGEAFPNISVPTRTGMIFGGYYTQANGQGTKIYNANGTPAVTASPFEADTTLYAYWKPYFDVEMTGATFTSKQVFDAEMINATLKITPQTGYRVSELSFDNTNWVDIEYSKCDLGTTAYAVNTTYLAAEQGYVFALKFEVFLHDFDTAGSIPIYLKTASGAYSGLKNSGSVSGVVVTATIGGMAYIVGDDFENLEDTDTITVSTKLCQPGYSFVGWYLDDDRTTAVSTATSYRVTKSVAYEHILVAVYQPTSGSGVNLDVDNSG